MSSNTEASLSDLLNMFQESVSEEDIESAAVVGKAVAKIVRRRVELGMTYEEFAEYVGVDSKVISELECRDCKFDIERLSDIIKKLAIKENVEEIGRWGID